MEGMALSSGLPPPKVFMAPASAMGSFPMLPAHPNVRKFSQAVTPMLKMLEKAASVSVKLKVTVPDAPAEQKNEEAHAILDAVRSSVTMLNGTRARVLERDLARFVPHLAPKYIKLRREAIARMNELRAALAFFLGETDDETLGFEFVPSPPPASGTSAPSVALDLG